MMFLVFIRILRAWEVRNELAGIFIRTPGKYTESVVLLDSAGSAYQIAVHTSGLCFRSHLTITDYVPETGLVLGQETFKSTILTLKSDLGKALQVVHNWMGESGSTRLPQEEEMALLRKMYERGTAGMHRSTGPNNRREDASNRDPLFPDGTPRY
jgi:hypothetical protein